MRCQWYEVRGDSKAAEAMNVSAYISRAYSLARNQPCDLAHTNCASPSEHGVSISKIPWQGWLSRLDKLTKAGESGYVGQASKLVLPT